MKIEQNLCIYIYIYKYKKMYNYCNKLLNVLENFLEKKSTLYILKKFVMKIKHFKTLPQ